MYNCNDDDDYHNAQWSCDWDSQAYGAMGWRVGYIAYPDYDGDDALGSEILKIQDTVPICPSSLSQQVALVSLTSGDEYVRSNIEGLAGMLTVWVATTPSAVFGLVRGFCKLLLRRFWCF